MKEIHLISNRLPLSVEKKEGEFIYSESNGGLATGLKSFHESGKLKWTGWPGITKLNAGEKNLITNQLEDQKINPVFLNEKEINLYYGGFSNRIIWPLFHNFCEYAEYKPAFWKAYKNVNQQFCDRVIERSGEDEIFWIHDYQLMLLPKMIREKRPNAKIGFFLHIPFPPPEIFRNLPWRNEILESLLAADLIGFHTMEYVRNFKNTIQKLLHGRNRVEDLFKAKAFPMGIDYEKFSTTSKSEEVVKKSAFFKRGMRSEKVILSIDRLDYSKGIIQRIKGFENFLKKNPEYKGKVSLLMIIVPSRTGVVRYQELKEEIDHYVGKINGQMGTFEWNPIHYLYRSFKFENLVALYKMADMALVTPLIDGMNLVAKEFVASKTDKKGVLILSEMAGAAKELKQALLINPNSVVSIAKAIKTGLEMPEKDQKIAISEMQKSLKTNNIRKWAQLFIENLSKENPSHFSIQRKNRIKNINRKPDFLESILK